MEPEQKQKKKKTVDDYLTLTFSMCCLILMSDGWIMCPVSLTFPCTTSASSGRSVLMPTLPVWTIDSGVVPRCQHSSASLSNWPGFEAFGGARKRTRKKKCHRPPYTWTFYNAVPRRSAQWSEMRLLADNIFFIFYYCSILFKKVWRMIIFYNLKYLMNSIIFILLNILKFFFFVSYTLVVILFFLNIVWPYWLSNILYIHLLLTDNVYEYALMDYAVIHT